MKQGDIADAGQPTVYTYTNERDTRFATLVLRTTVPPDTLAVPAAGAIRALDPEQPVENVRTMEEVRDDTLTSQRFTALLLAGFAARCAGARLGRDLQRPVVHRARPQPRDRHPHGARGADR